MLPRLSPSSPPPPLLAGLLLAALLVLPSCQACKLDVDVGQPVLIGDRLCIGEQRFAAQPVENGFRGCTYNNRMAAGSSGTETHGGTTYTVTRSASVAETFDDVSNAAWRSMVAGANGIHACRIEAYSWMWNALVVLGAEEGFSIEGQPVRIIPSAAPADPVALDLVP